MAGDLFDPALVTSSRESGLEPDLDDILGHPVGYEPCRHDEDIGVVVLLYELSYLRIPGESGADALMMVEGHGHTVSCAAKGDTEIYFTVLYG